jgi:hypothetical protein
MTGVRNFADCVLTSSDDLCMVTYMNPTTTTGQSGQKGESIMDISTFINLRADWKAQGCPADHAYLTTELTSGPIVPLVAGITTEMVEAASAMKAAGLMPERSVWA